MKTKLFLLAAFVFCAVKANADIQYSGTCGEHVTWRINTFIPDDYNPYPPQYNNGDTLYIEGYGEMTDYKDYYSVPWSPNNIHFYDIKYISIQEGVTSIGKSAFSYMAQDGNGLWITIPNTVTTIGFSAFMSSHISQINIPNSVTTIGKHAFEYCQLNSVIDIPSSVTDIGTGAFRYCTGLHSFNVAEDNPNYSSPNGLLCNKEQTILIQCPADIWESEFSFPSTITTIGRNAFAGCKYFQNLTIPNSVTTIEDYAFSYCESLQSITIPGSVTNIGVAVFGGGNLRSINVATDNYNYCSSDGVLFSKQMDTLKAYPSGRIGAYSIPNGVTTIAESAFVSSTKLTVINIPNSVTTIEKSAFSNCASLVSVTIPDGVTEIASSTFNQCTNLSLIDFGKKITRIGSFSFQYCSSLQSVVIPEGVKVIEWVAFDGCHNLSSISIPSTVDSIYRSAFHLDNLETVYNYSKVPQTISRDVFWDSYDEVKGTLYVPEESIALYQVADVWKEFSPILPLPSTEAIDIINTGESQHNITKKIAKDGQILILRGDKTYTLQGQEIK